MAQTRDLILPGDDKLQGETAVKVLVMIVLATGSAALSLTGLSVSAQPFYAPTSMCSSLLDEAYRMDERDYTTNPGWLSRKAEIPKDKQEKKQNVAQVVDRISAARDDAQLAEVESWINSDLPIGNGGSGGEAKFYSYFFCLIDEKGRMGVDQTQSVGAVAIRLKYLPGPGCYSVTVTNRTGKAVDAFVRLGISNPHGDITREITGWAGVPTVVRDRGAVVSAGVHFEGLASTPPGNSKTLEYWAAITTNEPDRQKLHASGPPPNSCIGVMVWLPKEGALKWEENALQKLADRTAAESQARRVQELETNRRSGGNKPK